MSTKPEKDKEFDEVFSPLGVIVDFSQATKGEIQVYGKPSRVKEVVTTVKGFQRRVRFLATKRARWRGGFAS